MTVQRKLRLGEAYPGRANSILVQIPTWADMVDFGRGKAQMDNGYPRSVVHPDIRLVRPFVILLFIERYMQRCLRSYVLEAQFRYSGFDPGER